MAELEDLVEQIPDPELRKAVLSALRDLKKRQRFGLVFEQHIPEVAVLPGLPIADGSLVRVKANPDESGLHRVLSISGDTATVEPTDGGPAEEHVLANLITVKRFGEPVYPALRPLGSVRRSEERPHHAVINGENYYVLQMLLYLYEGQVDCIYIDPPYNTGARDWKYNNRYVDSNDSWRHSKWLSFMGKRLRLAKRLLRPDGVLVVMIDEHELHHLGMLLEQLFPDYLRYIVSIVVNSRGSTGTRNFGVVEEQALFLVPDTGVDLIRPRESFVEDLHATRTTEAEDLLVKMFGALPDLAERLAEGRHVLLPDEQDLVERLPRERIEQQSELELGGIEEDEEDESVAPGEYWRGAVRTGQGTSFRTQRKNQFYPIFIDPETKALERVGEPLLDRDKDGNLVPPSWDSVDGLIPLWPTDEEGRERVWCFEPDRMKQEIAAGNLRVGRFNPRRNTYALNVRRIRRTERRFREITVWWEKSYDAGSNGTNILKNLLGESGTFPFPKSVYAVRDVLATVVGERPDALILDFFAGSATTFHATCLLNAVDDGDRRCILVTNNEVDAETADRLAAEGFAPGDPEFERHGIFEHVAMPRVKAVVEGKRPDGTTVPGRHRWAGGRPFEDGFEENVEFFRLDYLDPDEIDLGLQFDAILPALWLAAGGVGERPTTGNEPMLIPENSTFAVLFDEAKARDFADRLEKRPDITHVFVVTDSPEAYAETCSLFGPGRHTSMLYRDYLRNFEINTRTRA